MKDSNTTISITAFADVDLVPLPLGLGRYVDEDECDADDKRRSICDGQSNRLGVPTFKAEDGIREKLHFVPCHFFSWILVRNVSMIG